MSSGGEWKDLYQAAVAGDAARVHWRLSQGADPNHQHPEVLRTPLVASLVAGHPEVARLLLAHGARPGLCSEWDGLTPLQAALRHGLPALADELRQAGAALPARKDFGPRLWRRWLGL